MRALLFLALGLGACASDASSDTLQITTAHDSDAERETRRALESLLERHELGPWRFTDRVLIDESAIPHSHPTLTLHTRHNGDDPMLLATYLHEQLHWYVDSRGEAATRARAAFRARYPTPPVGHPEGARDEASAWLHLTVCWLELRALSQLIGEARARAVLARQDHYTWIYDQVLHDPEVARLNRAAGFGGSFEPPHSSPR